MKKSGIFLVSVAVVLAACHTSRKTSKTTVAATTASIANNGKVWASVFQQRSAEYRALCFQAYNVARLRIDEAVAQPQGRPLAVVTDIDETVLDNSPEDGRAAINNEDFSPAKWKAWTAKAVADTVPGAPAFLKYAASKGVTVFYITNRDEDERAATLKNLQRYNLPFADDQHLLLRAQSSSKEKRRKQVADNYNIVLLCGDNLPDFDSLYDNHPAEAGRTATTDQLQRKFGSRYIVLPNPVYGDWEGALFNFNYKLTAAQKDSIIKARIKIH